MSSLFRPQIIQLKVLFQNNIKTVFKRRWEKKVDIYTITEGATINRVVHLIGKSYRNYRTWQWIKEENM